MERLLGFDPEKSAKKGVDYGLSPYKNVMRLQFSHKDLKGYIELGYEYTSMQGILSQFYDALDLNHKIGHIENGTSIQKNGDLFNLTLKDPNDNLIKLENLSKREMYGMVEGFENF